MRACVGVGVVLIKRFNLNMNFPPFYFINIYSCTVSSDIFSFSFYSVVSCDIFSFFKPINSLNIYTEIF